MVYVAVFVPSPESLYLVTQQARRFHGKAGALFYKTAKYTSHV